MGSRYLFLDQLRFGETSEERNHAFEELVYMEEEGQIKEEDLFELLDHEDQVYQVYAIGAFGRKKIHKSVSKLKELYLKSDNPVILVALLRAFCDFSIGDFEAAVLKRIQQKYWKRKFKLKIDLSQEKIFDKDFVLDQILLPSLKYLQIVGTSGAEKVVNVYLSHSDPVVRWHCLMFYKKRELTIQQKILTEIAEKDDYALNREIAVMMLRCQSKN
ncbi:MAG: hypothetical protein OEY59_04835 [Deltaproteobacteria bacterium]|nr:hypothetical protein [Deltaproteobacteria bacterium]